MAKKKRESKGGSWMDTYGDMITLVLCFFVMLYAMSSIDQMKWELIVKSFNPNAEEISQIVTDIKNDPAENAVSGGADEPDTETEDFSELYYTFTKYIEENNLADDIEVSQGDGFTFITFRNNIFFDGNSYFLKDEGKEVLDNLAGALEAVKSTIEEVQVLGHTSQASPNIPNDVSSDRFLSSNRATVVLVYLQNKDVIEPSKLVASSYGQFRPISPFDTTESRARNRRVEILITENDSVVKTLEQYYTESSEDYREMQQQ